tara:strand:+ start:10523 stop:11122 length:600 start_codon:yes stop_codon:yes gene_type:complete
MSTTNKMSNVVFRVSDPSTLCGRELTLLQLLEREYTLEVAQTVLMPLMTQTSPISLRALDWAVVNWSKQHNIVCTSIVPGQMTNIHHSYRSALKYWKRRLFDPFRRRSRVTVTIEGNEFETTLGQANFALWSYKTGVLNYVSTNIEAIESDMNHVSQRQKRLRRDAKRDGYVHKRHELTQRNTSLCVAYRAPQCIRFSK